jgi:hypothetical protein
MKTRRTLSGIKRIEATDREVTLLQVRDILNEQRKVLINRLLADLHTYIDYKFRVKANSQQLEHIKEKLDSLKNYAVDLSKYGTILQQVFENDSTYINTEPFYNEIDENILWYLNDAPLRLVK